MIGKRSTAMNEYIFSSMDMQRQFGIRCKYFLDLEIGSVMLFNETPYKLVEKIEREDD
jgi:hypothetical protein